MAKYELVEEVVREEESLAKVELKSKMQLNFFSSDCPLMYSLIHNLTDKKQGQTLLAKRIERVVKRAYTRDELADVVGIDEIVARSCAGATVKAAVKPRAKKAKAPVENTIGSPLV